MPTHEELSKYTHGELSRFTHEQLSNKEDLGKSIQNLVNEFPEEVSKKSEDSIRNLVQESAKKFKKYSEDFEKYRLYFKQNKHSRLDEKWEEKKKEFGECSKQFNEDFDLFVKSLSEGFKDRKNYELELLVYLQLAQTKNTRVHNRLHKAIMKDAEDKIKSTEEKIRSTEKNLEKQQKNLKNVYTGFMTIIGVFLTIFTLVSANLNFFGNIIKNEDLSISKISGIFLLVNSVAIISISALILLLFASIRYFNETKEFKEKRWLFIFIVPFVLMGLALLLIA